MAANVIKHGNKSFEKLYSS